MNLEDVIDPEYGLQQDDWSLSKPTFGKDNQLTVVGLIGKRVKTKTYLLHCSACAEDPELFGEGYFKALKSNLVKGTVPCGCGKNVSWNAEQYRVRIKRKVSKDTPYTFIKFATSPVNNTTKVVMNCPAHGAWDSTNVNSILSQGGCCPSCKYENISNNLRLEDQAVIDDFLRTGSFVSGTKFSRCFDINKKGTYWYVECPVCEEKRISNQSDIKLGKVPCLCGGMAQKNTYISVVYDNSIPVALKFGIAVNPFDRCYKQNLSSRLDIKILSCFTFVTKQACIEAEKACKSQLECAIISKQDFPDGYTETTYLYNFEKIVEIFENFGGQLTFKSEEYI